MPLLTQLVDESANGLAARQVDAVLLQAWRTLAGDLASGRAVWYYAVP